MSEKFTSNYSNPQLSTIALNGNFNNPQHQIDQLNKTATTDPNLTVEEYAKQMSGITGEPNQFTYLNEEQLNIDKLNKEAASNPNMTVGDYMDQMTGITGEPISEVGQSGNQSEGEPKYKHEKEYEKARQEFREKQDKIRIEEEMKSYSATDWEAAMKDPSKINMSTKEEVLDKYISEHQGKIKETKSALEAMEEKKSKNKKNLNQSYNENNNSTSNRKKKKEKKELEEKLKRQQAKAEGLEYRKKRSANKTVAEQEVTRLKGLKKNIPIDDNYINNIAEIEGQIDGVGKKLATQNKVLKAQSKATIQGTLKGSLSPFKVVNTLFAGTQAIGSYKESRAEGHGVVNSVVKGVGDLMLTEALGPIGYGVYHLAKAAPKAALKGTNMLYQENRRMNSASNFVPLGGVNFQDTPELATMRQSGMELAKMSQYNLEQTLMGAEAKHLHR